MENNIVIISLGGSVIVPDSIDIVFLKKVRKLITELNGIKKFVLITGGGRICRMYNEAANGISKPSNEDLDLLGIMATRLNATLLLTIFKDIAYPEVIENPTLKIKFNEDVLVSGGWKPGFSTDYCAVKLAQNLGASTVINITDTDYVYDKDPKKSPDAKPIEKITWEQMQQLIGKKWSAGMHMPFDPIASQEASKLRINVVIVGKDIKNLKRCIEGKKFRGTVIS